MDGWIRGNTKVQEVSLLILKQEKISSVRPSFFRRFPASSSHSPPVQPKTAKVAIVGEDAVKYRLLSMENILRAFFLSSSFFH